MKKSLSVAVAAVAWIGLTGCLSNPFAGGKAAPLSYQEQVENFMSTYKTLKPNKAMAYTKGENGQYVFGQAFEYKSLAGAKARALKQCNDRRIALKVAKKCELLAVGDTFLKKL